VKIAQTVNDELNFKAKISKMGDNKIIWIPAALHEMLKDFEKDDVMVSIKKVSRK
jgi:antitoxin component of MazEF toxin-antitoxin module